MKLDFGKLFKSLCLLVIIVLCGLGTASAENSEITKPQSNEEFKSGEIIPIEIDTKGDASIRDILVTSELGNMILDKSSLTGEIQIPADFVGTLSINASIKREDSTIGATEFVYVTVQKNEQLTSISLGGDSSEPIYLFNWSPKDYVKVLGTFSDGAIIDIKNSEFGTEYASSDTSIFTVNEDGLLEGRSEGEAILTIRNGEFKIKQRVIVKHE